MRKKRKGYVSEIDQFMALINYKQSDLSLFKQREVDKYKRIHYLRDHAERPKEMENLDLDEEF